MLSGITPHIISPDAPYMGADSGFVSFYNSESFVLSGSNFDEWTDLGPNGYDIDSVAGTVPITTDTVLGRQVLEMTRNANYLHRTTTPDVVNPYVFTLINPDAGQSHLWNTSDGGIFPLTTVQAAGHLAAHGGIRQINGTINVIDGNWHLVEYYLENNAVRFFVDGVEDTLDRLDLGTNLAFNGIMVGRQQNTTTNRFDGKMGATIIYDGDPGDAVRQHNRRWYNAYYNGLNIKI